MAAAGLVVCGALATAGTIAEAAPGTKKHVTICHTTGDPANPYVKLKVRTRYADGPAKRKGSKSDKKDYYVNFKGPLAPGTDGTWGDIIPPIKKKHGGLNWTTEGQAIYQNGCKLLTAPPPSSSTTTVSPTTSTSISGPTSSTSTSISVPPSTTTSISQPPSTTTSISEPPSTTTTAWST